MSEEKPPNPTKFVFNLDTVRALATLNCTTQEMAYALGCSTKTIDREKKRSAEFRQVLEKGYADYASSIRRKQLEVALGTKKREPNVRMLIHLGKTQLGQTEKIINEHTGKDGAPLYDNSPDAAAVERIAALLESARARRDLQAAGDESAVGSPPE